MWLAFLLCIIYRSLLMLLLLPFRSMMDSCCVVSSDLHTPGERRWRIHGIPRIQQPEDPRIGPMRSWPWSPCIRAHSSEFAQLGEAHFHFVEVVLVGMVYLSFENSSHHPSHKTSIPSLSSLPMPFFFTSFAWIEFYSRCLSNHLHIQNSRTWEPWYCATTIPMVISRHWDTFFRVHLYWRSLLCNVARYNNVPFFYSSCNHMWLNSVHCLTPFMYGVQGYEEKERNLKDEEHLRPKPYGRPVREPQAYWNHIQRWRRWPTCRVFTAILKESTEQ